MVHYNYLSGTPRSSRSIDPMFRDVGITINVSKVDYTEFNSQLIQRTFEEAADGWPAPAQDASGYFHNQVRSDSGGNRWRINDPDIDQWADEQQFELDPDARREIHRKIWDRLLERPPDRDGNRPDLQRLPAMGEGRAVRVAGVRLLRLGSAATPHVAGQLAPATEHAGPEVRRTVHHEIAHHFGFDEHAMERLDLD